MTKAYNHFIGGAMVTGKSGSHKNIFNPSLGDVSGTVVLANTEEVDLAVKSAQEAFPGWAALNPQRRARVMFNFKRLIEENADELALIISEEHGKVLADSHGDIQRGLAEYRHENREASM